MKTLVSLDGGVLVVQEEAGKFELAVNDAFVVGGGQAAGIVSVKGSASIVLSGKQAFDLGMALLKAHSPAALIPIEEGAQAIADAAIDKA